MLQFVCDTCSALKQEGDTWIVGIAAEAIGVTSARREVTLLPVWDRERAVHPLAIHFCSVECKDRYMERLFGPEALTDEIVVERTLPVGTVVDRRAPVRQEKVVTEVGRRQRRPRKKSA
jgi:hypothetical protein